MRIIFDCFKLVKGAGKSIGIYNVALNLVKSLVEEQRLSNNNEIINSKIIVLGNSINKEDFAIPNVEFYDIPKLNPLNRFHCLIWELFSVSKYARQYNGDRIVFPRGFCALRHSIKDIVIIHDCIPFYYNKNYPHFFNKMENAYIMNRLKYSVKHSYKVITISQASKNEILHYCNRKADDIEVIYNNCKLINFSRKTETNLFLKNQKYISAITSYLPHKNANGIIQSYKEYLKISDNPLPLVMIGVNEDFIKDETDDIKKHIKCIKFIKDNSELYNIIAGSSVFVFLSLVEGFGLPPLEVMQLNVPVICSNLSSLPEVVGDAAILVNPNNYKEVAVQLNNVLNDKKLQENLIVRGQINYKRFLGQDFAKAYWKALLN